MKAVERLFNELDQLPLLKQLEFMQKYIDRLMFHIQLGTIDKPDERTMLSIENKVIGLYNLLTNEVEKERDKNA